MTYYDHQDRHMVAAVMELACASHQNFDGAVVRELVEQTLDASIRLSEAGHPDRATRSLNPCNLLSWT